MKASPIDGLVAHSISEFVYVQTELCFVTQEVVFAGLFMGYLRHGNSETPHL